MSAATGADRFIETNGLELHYVEWGNSKNPPLVMLHGVASLARIWDRIAPSFASEYRVLSLDWRGHGDSQWAPDSDYSFDAYVTDLEALASALDLRGITLVGHSLGGYNALQFTSQNPQTVRAVVAADVRTGITPEEVEQMKQASVRPQKEIDSSGEILNRFAASLAPTSAPKDVIESIGRHAVRESSPGKWVFKFDRRALAIPVVNPWPILPKISVPTLIMRGEGSSMMPREGAMEMARLIPDGRFKEIAGAHHHLFLDQPQEFATTVRSFLQF